MELRVRNVNVALQAGTTAILFNGHRRSSRAGEVLEMPDPMITIYECPTERVLFSKARDANPFLHLFESLWMMAGRKDLDFLRKLTSRFTQYSDDGVSMQGSYGWKWRSQFGFDQIQAVINLLREDPNSRRAVIVMWHPEDLRRNLKSSDIPCNTTIYFKIHHNALRMTVCNRSNDMLWGAYGANAVHMSILQEYIAAALSLNIGEYWQVSDSFHVYTTGEGGKVWDRVAMARDLGNLRDDRYGTREVEPTAMFSEGVTLWDEDLTAFFAGSRSFKTEWWSTVALPMWDAFQGRSLSRAMDIAASDWRVACMEWLDRRRK